jgi:hypothetical protein
MFTFSSGSISSNSASAAIVLVCTCEQVGAQKLAMQLDYNGWLSTKCSHLSSTTTSSSTASSSSSNISSSNMSGVARSTVDTGQGHSNISSAVLPSTSAQYTIRRLSQPSAAQR